MKGRLEADREFVSKKAQANIAKAITAMVANEVSRGVLNCRNTLVFDCGRAALHRGMIKGNRLTIRLLVVVAVWKETKIMG
jgi:hypothetical protein